MNAWLLMQKHQGKGAPYSHMLESIDRALELYSKHEKANLYKAQVLRRMGEPESALQWFRKVVEINPNNIEAAREVRVATMRKSASKGKGDKAGRLLGKLFGKK
jgi:tetratricopeptide (TPR) repeat protein